MAYDVKWFCTVQKTVKWLQPEHETPLVMKAAKAAT